MIKYLFTLGQEDVGSNRRKITCMRCKHTRTIVLPFNVRDYDLGKRVYDNSGVIQVENDEQRDRRKNEPH